VCEFKAGQLCPNIFKALRVKIDEARDLNERFLLSGSSPPELLHQINESLAGRVATIDVPCLAWNEALERPLSNIYASLDDPDSFLDLQNHYNLAELYEFCLYGLYPEAFLKRKSDIDEFSSPYGLIINNGSEVRKLADKIYQVPAIFWQTLIK